MEKLIKANKQVEEYAVGMPEAFANLLVAVGESTYYALGAIYNLCRVPGIAITRVSETALGKARQVFEGKESNSTTTEHSN